jgi:hypothetical protein
LALFGAALVAVKFAVQFLGRKIRLVGAPGMVG